MTACITVLLPNRKVTSGKYFGQKCWVDMCLLQEYVKDRQGDPSTAAPPPNPLMMGMDAGGYVLKTVGSVKVHALFLLFWFLLLRLPAYQPSSF